FGIDEGAAAAFDLTEVVDVTFGRDGPENVGRVWATEFRCAWQIVNAELDASAATAGALHLGFAFQTRQHSRTAKLHRHRLVQRVRNRDGLSFNIPLSKRNGDG